MKISAAPVSWGVFVAEDEVPAQLVLDQMVATGYAGTELGPAGYLGSPEEVKSNLAARELELVGAFVPLGLSHSDRAQANERELRETLDLLEAAQPGEVRPVALLSDMYELPVRIASAGRVPDHPEAWLSDEGWKELLEQVHRLASICHERSFDVAFHPHVGTYIETPDEIARLFDGLDTSLIGWCLDTGHSYFGGSDPLELLETYGDILRWVHLKDVELDVLAELKSDGFGLDEAWRRGIFCELGRGGVDVDAVLKSMRDHGYDDWIVVEQDLIPDPSRPADTLLGVARENRDFLRQRDL
jgi:inosose dehydratase